MNMLDFNDGAVTISHYNIGKAYEIGEEGATICNDEGQLSLVSNGCHISNKELDIIIGGDTIDGYDWAYKNYCELGLAMPSFQSTMIFNQINSHIVIHKNLYIDEGSKSSTIRMKKIIGEGIDFQVISDEVIIDTTLMFGKLKTTFHHNRDDIWVIANPFNSNEFISILINKDSIIRMPAQKLGPILDDYTFGRFKQVAFSSNNNMMAMNSVEGLLVYDFDDETGVLSNFKLYKYPTLISDGIHKVASGICFSPSGDYAYVSNVERIFQIDLSSNPDDPDYYDYGFQWIAGPDGWPIGVGNMMTGPDCRIYASCGTTTNFMHVIHYPDRKGAAAELQKHIPVPMRIDNDFPLVPNLFPTCDSTIVFDISTSVLEPINVESPLILYPNPAVDRTTLTISPELKGTVFVFDMLGREVMQKDKAVGEREVSLDLEDFIPGNYVIRFESGGERFVGKLVKI